MGNSQCCEEEAKGGEFNQNGSRFHPNKIKLQPNKFNNINFSEPPHNLKILHENQPFLQSPPAKLHTNRWSGEDLPVIQELMSKEKQKEEEASGNQDMVELEKESKLKEIKLRESNSQGEHKQLGQSNHSSSLHKLQAVQQLNKALQQHHYHENPPSRQHENELARKEELSEIQMPKLNQSVLMTLQAKKFFEEKLTFEPQRRQYESDFYEGQLDKNRRFPNGFGKLYKADNSLYIGHFAKGKAQGQGAFIFPDGSYYFGPFSNNTAEGKEGVYESSTFRYDGEFKNNRFHGLGIESGPAHKFNGQYYNGLKTHGVLTWTEGQHSFQYEGSFQNNLFDGEGKLVEPLGTYTGQFIRGKKHGHGTYQFKNGLMYIGDYREGTRSGKGALYNPNKKIAYEGEFQNGLPHGDGIVLDKNGKKCTTKWVEGIDEDLL